MPADAAPLIAVIDASEPVVELIATILRDEGFRTVTLCSALETGPLAVVDFLSTHRPAACVYSVSRPYDQSWATLQALRRHLPACPFIVTTTNKAAVQRLIGPQEPLELVGKPFALEELLAAVQRTVIDPSAGAPDAP